MPEAVSTERLTEALLRPGAYADAPEAVSLVQTHASLLFFAGVIASARPMALSMPMSSAGTPSKSGGSMRITRSKSSGYR